MRRLIDPGLWLASLVIVGLLLSSYFLLQAAKAGSGGNASPTGENPTQTLALRRAQTAGAAKSAETQEPSNISFVEPLAAPLRFLYSFAEIMGIAAGDFNGDGLRDLAVTGQGPFPGFEAGREAEFVAVLLGNGDSTFQAAVAVADLGGNASDPAGMVAGDFDEDGILDLAVAASRSSVRQVLFLKGRGDGTFEGPLGYDAGNRPTSLRAADLNGDGHLDLVTAGEYEAAVSVLLGNGDGTFRSPTVHAVSTNPMDLAVVDVDGGNGPDILVTSWSASLDVLLNNGSGGFPTTANQQGVSIQGRSLSIGDFDEDGNPDAVVTGVSTLGSCNGGCLAFLHGNGDGTFEAPEAQDVQAIEGFPRNRFGDSRPLDLNGDGHLDLFTVNSPSHNTVTVALGRGNGTFTITTWVGSPGFPGNTNYVDGHELLSGVADDFNGDGVYDLALAADNMSHRGRGGVSILPGDPNAPGTFLAPRVLHLSRWWSSTSRSTALGDFDNDAALDLAAITDPLDWFKGRGDGTFVESSVKMHDRVAGAGEFYTTLEAADFDRDGNLDLVWLGVNGVQGGPGSRHLVLWGDGNGSGSAAVIGYPPGGYAGRNLAVGDYNNDTHPDLAVLNLPAWSAADGIVQILLYDANAAEKFSPAAGVPISQTTGRAIVSGFFDGDNNLDLVTYSYSPDRLFFLRGHGDGSFSSAVVLTDAMYSEVFQAADLNGDGRLDLVGAAGNNNGVWVLLGNGDGTFQAPVFYPSGTNATSLHIADFDGNGTPDLAVGHGMNNTGGNGFAVLPGRGDGTFGEPLRFAIGQNQAFTLRVDDLNADGRPDAMVNFTVLLNDSGPRADLAVDVQQAPGEVEVGQVLTYTIIVTNLGPDGTTNVRVRNPLRTGYLFLDAATAQGTCTHSSTLLNCNLPTLAAGATATVTMQVMVTRRGSLWNTASAVSDVRDPDTANNSDAVSQYVLGGLRVFGPTNVAVGGTFDYVIRYVNLSAQPMENAVVLLDLPRTASFLSGSHGAIYIPERHEVIWKLGTLPGYARGDLSVKVEIPWGIPAHTPHRMTAFWGATNWTDNLFDVNFYQAYEPREVVSEQELSADEIQALLDGDGELRTLFEQAQNAGFMDYQVASRTTFNDGTYQVNLWLFHPEQRRFAAVTDANGSKTILYYDRDFYAFGDAGGSLIYDPNTGSFRSTGSWAQINSPSLGQCTMACIADKLPGKVFETINAVKKVMDAADCTKCALSKGADGFACAKCLGAVRDIPGVGEGVDVAECVNDCLECIQGNQDKCYRCTKDLRRCRKANWFERFVFMSQAVVEIRECAPQGNYLWGSERLICPSCPYGERCEGDQCGCNPPPCKRGTRSAQLGASAMTAQIPAYCPLALNTAAAPSGGCSPNTDTILGEVRTANDPNAKYGPAGDVFVGQTTTYTITYENEGQTTAFGVYIVDPLDPNLDADTLVIHNGGEYLAATRTLFWKVGDVPAGEGGAVSFQVRVKDDVPAGTQIANVATIVFPSVPQFTETNPVVSTVRALVAMPQDLATEESAPLNITLQGISPAGNPLSYIIVTQPLFGTLTGSPPQVTYTPAEGFDGLDSFTFKVSDGATESEPATVHVLVTPSAFDTTPPQVIATYPAGKSNIPVAVNLPFVIRADFNEALDPGTVTTSSVEVRAGTTVLTGTVQFDGTTNRLQFTSNVPMAYGTTYQVTLSTGIRDSSGNPLARPYTWIFHTFEDQVLNASPSPLDLGPVILGATQRKVLTVYNTSAGNTVMGQIALGGPDAGEFSVPADGCTGNTVVPGGTCAIEVAFTPTSAGHKAAQLAVHSDSGTVEVTLTALGMEHNLFLPIVVR